MYYSSFKSSKIPHPQQVVNKYAHETARADLSKRKLEKTYIDCLQIDRIELHAFASGKYDSTTPRTFLVG